MNFRRAAILLALLSPVFSIGVMIWIRTRPQGAFHDERGMLLTFVWFPLTFGVWILSALFSLYCASQCPKQGPGAMPGDVRWINWMLIFTGLCLSLLAVSFP